MKTAIDILDEMIKENIEVRNFDLYGSIRMNVTARYIYERIEEEITRAKEKIQALGDGCELQTLKPGDGCFFSNDGITWRYGVFNGYASGRYTQHHFAMKNLPPITLPPNK